MVALTTMNALGSPKAFLSHASDDKVRFVRGFAARLMENGVDVWLDEWEINPGDNPVRKIFEEGLPKCQVVILVISAVSVQKPWVREEIDAAFVRKVEGQAKLIPIRLDECQMPECLKTTRWESIDDLTNYDPAFQRILNGIFGNYPKPALGPVPPYAQSPVLAISNLNRVDSLLFEKACRIAVEQGHTFVNDEAWLKTFEGMGLTEEQIADSQQILEEHGFIKRHRTIGPHRIYAFTITMSGFQEFATISVPNFADLVSRVAAALVRQEHMTGGTIATALGQPLRIVEHILELLESRSLIQIGRQLGGDYMTVFDVSARLRRVVAGEM